MNHILMGHQISKELYDALGLPPNTIGFTLRCYSREIVSVECEYCPDGSFQSALAQYQLTARRDVKAALPAEPFDYDTWMRARTERAHRELMERTSRMLPCDLKLVPPAVIRRYLGDRPY